MSTNGKTKSVFDEQTLILRASELHELLVRVFEVKAQGKIRQYARDIAVYEKAIGRKNITEVERRGEFVRQTFRGYWKVSNGEPEWVQRPTPPTSDVFAWSTYDRSMGFTSHAMQWGLLADPKFNREIRVSRVEEYVAEMRAGRWQDLLSDPIAITAGGHVLNGQHRLAAAHDVHEKPGWDKVGNDPRFLVVLGASPSEALFADGSRRTAKDEKTIASKLVAAA
jgi:hypothetical protein